MAIVFAGTIMATNMRAARTLIATVQGARAKWERDGCPPSGGAA